MGTYEANKINLTIVQKRTCKQCGGSGKYIKRFPSVVRWMPRTCADCEGSGVCEYELVLEDSFHDNAKPITFTCHY